MEVGAGHESIVVVWLVGFVGLILYLSCACFPAAWIMLTVFVWLVGFVAGSGTVSQLCMFPRSLDHADSVRVAGGVCGRVWYRISAVHVSLQLGSC